MPRVLDQEANQPQEVYVVRRLKPGMEHYGQRDGAAVVFENGEEVELTEAQSKAFDDKFFPAEDGPKLRVAKAKGIESEKPSEEDLKAALSRPVPTSHSPQDIGAKTATPGLPDANPGNRTGGPRGPVAGNPTDADVDGHPPIRDSHTATIVGGPLPPADVVGRSANAGAPGGPGTPPATPSTPPSPATAPTATPSAPSAPTPPKAPGNSPAKK